MVPPEKVSLGFDRRAGVSIKDTDKVLIAQYAAASYTTGEIATLFKYTFAEVQRHLARKSVQVTVESETNQLLETARRGFGRWLLHADKLYQDQLDDALNDKCPHHYDARKYILGHLAAQRQSVVATVDVNLNMSNEVMAGLTAALKGAGAALQGEVVGNTGLLAGKEAMPSVNVDDAISEGEIVKEGEQLVEGGPVVSGRGSQAGVFAARAGSPADDRYQGPKGLNGSKSPGSSSGE